MKIYENLRHGTDEFPVGIHDTICSHGFSLYPHIHREFEFLVMTEGKGTVYIENEKFEIKAGEGLFINSEELHIGIKTDNEPARFFAVVFAPEVFGNLAMDTIVQKYVKPVIEKQVRAPRRLDEAVIELLYKVHEKPGELKIKALLYDIWDKCLAMCEKCSEGARSKAVDEMKTVMEYMRENCHRSIALEDMAKHINISKGYLCREFRRVIHMTPFEYLTRLRIDKSCDMLKSTDLSVGCIAERCGFNSFSYFTKIFREKMGCSPKEYRNKSDIL
ncbi:MAG: AraC family transcriptional regulator [Clostridia bacterium]|nr:AraC family transcriptional regulator [Clostridia bacterium]